MSNDNSDNISLLNFATFDNSTNHILQFDALNIFTELIILINYILIIFSRR